MIETALALCGVLLGGLLTNFGQRANAARVDERARDESTRQARIQAFSAFAAASNSYRRAVVGRTIGPLRGDVDDAVDSLRTDVRLSRAAAWEAYYHLRLLAPDEDIAAQAKSVIYAVKALRLCSDPQTLDDAADQVRKDIDTFIDRAKAHVL